METSLAQASNSPLTCQGTWLYKTVITAATTAVEDIKHLFLDCAKWSLELSKFFLTTRLLYFQYHLVLSPFIHFLSTECDMGCCFSNPVDYDGEVTLYHFDLLRAVGKGAFGKVFGSHSTPLCLVRSPRSEQVRVVQHKRSKMIYALKYIDKSRCLRQKAVANIIQERRLLEEVTILAIIRLKCPNNIPAG